MSCGERGICRHLWSSVQVEGIASEFRIIQYGWNVELEVRSFNRYDLIKIVEFYDGL